MSTPLLELQRVSAAYGPFRALFGVDLSIDGDSALALVGPNGAGKTTVARVCSGLLAPTAGKILFEGDDVTRLPAFELSRRGIAHANEGRSIFASLTVEQNLTLALRGVNGRGRIRAGVREAYDLFPKLGDRRNQIGGSLSGGEQRMLSLARVLVLGPKLLIADELSLGLAPVVIDSVYQMLLQVRQSGTAVLVVEQHLDRALDFADRTVVLDTGEVAWQGPSSEVDDNALAFLHPAGSTS